MIEKMKKLSLLIYHSSRDKFLTDMQKLGVVHLEVNSSAQDEKITSLNNSITHYKKIEKLLKEQAKTLKIKPEQKAYNDEIDKLLHTIENEERKLDDLTTIAEDMRKEIALITPWGLFDPLNITRLNEIGLDIKFYATPKSKFEKIDKENLIYDVISREKGYVYFIVIYREGEEVREIEAVEAKFPLENLHQLENKLAKLNEEIEQQQQVLNNYCKYLDIITEHRTLIEDELSYYIASASLEEEVEGKVLIITGWYPIKNENNVTTLLDKEDVVYLIDEPTEEDNVPVKLKNGPFARLFEPITKLHSLPQYTEVDPTPFFAPFFAAFFGLCLADLGYGLVMTTIVMILLFMKKLKNMRPILLLGLAVSITTIIGGIILDTFFGQGTLTYMTQKSILPGGLNNVMILRDLNSAMAFALFIGITQVVIGILIHIKNRITIFGFLGIFHPLGSLCILFGGLLLLIKDSFIILGPLLSNIPNDTAIITLNNSHLTVKTTIALTSFILGFLFIFFFNNLDKKKGLRFGILWFWELYNVITGLLGDILSYIRLFALGLAGGLLGKSFNDIAFMVLDSAPPVVNIIGMILIMALGHSLNFGLAALSAFVHPLRLILLEFYNNVNFTGGGLPYSPFKNKILIKKEEKGA